MTASARFGLHGQRFEAGETAAAIGPDHWQRLCAFDAGGALPARPSLPPPGPPLAHYDVILAGGGLSLLLAPLFARAGLQVAVIDRGRVGSVHREWNASARELEALVQAGLCTHAELQTLIVARYSHGTCRWHGQGTTVVRGVLDCAVDASALLRGARAKAAQAGVALFDGVEVGEVEPGDDGVRVAVRARVDVGAPAARPAGPDQAALPVGAALPPLGEGVSALHCGVFVDARGVHSPYAKADLACPTVGGVFADLDIGSAPNQYLPNVGEILATTEDVEGGRQHLWEAFPGREGEVTVYLFAYAPHDSLGERPLARLYERFWATLPRFKRGTPRLLRPTYGIIPGWSRLRPGAQSPHRRILLVGDAAARHSPLTYCGFGAMLRSLPVTFRAVRAVLAEPRGRPLLAAHDTALHSATGVLASLMAAPPSPPAALNAILATSFATLAQMGNERYADMLQDRLPPNEVAKFLWRVSRKHPTVWRHVMGTIGPLKAMAWTSRLAWQGARAAM